jgi:hypothetical protein
VHGSAADGLDVVDQEWGCAGLLCEHITIEFEGECEVGVAEAGVRIEENASGGIFRDSSIEMPDLLIGESLGL